MNVGAYPAHEERDVVLRSGSTLRIRPIRTDDAGRLVDFYGRLSPDSLYFRFFAPSRVDSAAAARFCRVDYDSQYAFVGDAGGRIVAIAQYFRLPKHPDRAEIAFAVEDALQRQGIGTRLLDRLADVARSRGIRTFEADYLARNKRMADVFRNCGFTARERRLDGSVEKIVLDITPTPAYLEHALGRSEQAAFASMRRLFEPSAIAVIGASAERGKIGAEILHNLRSRFQGEIVPINPMHEELLGSPCYPRLTDAPGPVDLAVIAIPAAHLDAVVDDCVAKGVSGIVIITAGFSETGEEGRQRESALLEKVRAAGIRMVGPNCMGLINTDPKVRLNATFAPVYPPAGRVALSSQSGALGLALLDYADKLNLGISSFVSVGNKADVSSNDLIQYWAEDPRTDVILLYLESFGNPSSFREDRATRRASEADRGRQVRTVPRGLTRRVLPHGGPR